MTGPESGDARDVLVVLHPERPQVLTDDAGGFLDASVDDPPASWHRLLAVAQQVLPDGVWPLGPSRWVSSGLGVHVAQARTSSVPPGYRWSDGPDPRWSEPLRRAVVTTLDEDAGRVPTHPLRMPWMRRGWWTEATAWVDARLDEVGRRRTGALEPKEHWGISAVARVPATGGAVWLKSVPPIFTREPAVLAVLGERFPGRVPPVLAVAAEDGGGSRCLTEDVGPVPDDADEADPPLLAVLLADLQIRSLDLLPRLSAAGCVDRTPERLAAELARMAEDGFEIDLLDADERAALRRRLPELTDRLLAISTGPLPTVLVHGDYHAWNIARPPGWLGTGGVIIDWTDAAIGPVGVDLTTLLPATAGDAARTMVALAYASAWARHLDLSLAEVETALAAVVPAAHVVQALAYDEILRAIEPVNRWPLSGVMAQRLRALLPATAG